MDATHGADLSPVQVDSGQVLMLRTYSVEWVGAIVSLDVFESEYRIGSPVSALRMRRVCCCVFAIISYDREDRCLFI